MKQRKQEFETIHTLREMLDNSAKKYPLRRAFATVGENGSLCSISYKEFYADVKNFANGLCSLGLANEKTAICMKNCYDWCVAYFAVCTCVGTVVPLDKETPSHELVNIINFAQIDAVVTDGKTAQKILEHKDALTKDILIISTEKADGALNFETVCEKGREICALGESTFEFKKPEPEDLAALLFTSGTTGMAKGVMLTHENICSDMTAVIGCIEVGCEDSTHCVLPLHHAYQSIVVLMMLYIGGCVSFSQGLRQVAKELTVYKPSLFVSVPLMLEKMHEKIMQEISRQTPLKRSAATGGISHIIKTVPPALKKKIYSKIYAAFGGNIRLIITGAAMMNEEVAKSYASFGIPVIIGYGLTECSPIVICNSSSDPKPDSIGKPLPGVEGKIENAGEDGVGEICVKGPMVMKGYYKNDEETKKVLRDGWFYTGDLGYIDKDGFYHITGRNKNVIVNKNGKNIYPEELEYYLCESPLIKEALVFSNENVDERISACILPNDEAVKNKLKSQSVGEEEIRRTLTEEVRRINAGLPSYKSVRRIVLRFEEFEKTTTTKIKRCKENQTGHGSDILL